MSKRVEREENKKQKTNESELRFVCNEIEAFWTVQR